MSCSSDGVARLVDVARRHDQHRAVGGVQHRATGGSEQHALEAAAAAGADDDQLRLLGVLAEHAHRPIPSDDALDDDVRITFPPAGEPLRQHNFLAGLNAAPVRVVRGGAEGRLDAHIAPHVDRDQCGVAHRGFLERSRDSRLARLRPVHADDDRALGGRTPVEGAAADDRDGTCGVRSHRSGDGTDDQPGDLAVAVRTEDHHPRLLRQVDQYGRRPALELLGGDLDRRQVLDGLLRQDLRTVETRTRGVTQLVLEATSQVRLGVVERGDVHCGHDMQAALVHRGGPSRPYHRVRCRLGSVDGDDDRFGCAHWIQILLRPYRPVGHHCPGFDGPASKSSVPAVSRRWPATARSASRARDGPPPSASR